MLLIIPRFFLFIVSIYITPGSPLIHAIILIKSKILFASTTFTTSFVLGFIKLNSFLLSTASINSSVIATEILKFFKKLGSTFELTNFIMSGCVMSNIPIFAPRRLPPCLITSVVISNIFIKPTGPAAAGRPLTKSLNGLRFEKLNPVPPPVC